MSPPLLFLLLALPRLGLLGAYCVLVVAGSPWWGLPCLVLCVLGWGCKAPPLTIVQGAKS